MFSKHSQPVSINKNVCPFVLQMRVADPVESRCSCVQGLRQPICSRNVPTPFLKAHMRLVCFVWSSNRNTKKRWGLLRTKLRSKDHNRKTQVFICRRKQMLRRHFIPGKLTVDKCSPRNNNSIYFQKVQVSTVPPQMGILKCFPHFHLNRQNFSSAYVKNIHMENSN